MSSNKPSVFISYRRENSQSLAQKIYKQLWEHGYDVFLDVENIDTASFDSTIQREIASKSHFLLLLSPGTLERSRNTNDWVRREIECAFRTKRHIIPVLVGESDFEKELGYLPKSLHAKLSHQQPLRLQPEYLEAGVQALLRVVDDPPKEKSLPPKRKLTPKVLEAKLQEDDLYTLLYGYVRKFDPSPDLMVYTGEESSKAELKAMVEEAAQILKKSYGIDLTPTVKRVTDLVKRKRYDDAIDYIRLHADKVEQEIEKMA